MAKREGGSTQSKGKKCRKFDRNKVWCKKYRDLGRRMINKLKKLERHIRHMPNDIKAQGHLRRLLT